MSHRIHCFQWVISLTVKVTCTMAYLVQGQVVISQFYRAIQFKSWIFQVLHCPFSHWSYLMNFTQLSITLSVMLFSRFHSDEHCLEWLALHRVFSQERCLEWLKFVLSYSNEHYREWFAFDWRFSNEHCLERLASNQS